MSKKEILIVEDEEDIIELLKYNLEMEGFSVRHISSGNNIVSEMDTYKPDLVLLDVMLPDKDGLSVCRDIRESIKYAHIPVIMLTAKSQDHHVIAGLESGANDYISKPFNIGVLVARIHSCLRHKHESIEPSKDYIQYANIELFLNEHRVLVDDQPVELNHSEFKLLAFLISKPGWVYSRDQLIDVTKGENYIVTDRSIDVLMVSLRKKMGIYADYIETVRGVGYRFKKYES